VLFTRTVTASTMIARLEWRHKVRRHSGAEENGLGGECFSWGDWKWCPSRFYSVPGTRYYFPALATLTPRDPTAYRAMPLYSASATLLETMGEEAAGGATAVELSLGHW